MIMANLNISFTVLAEEKEIQHNLSLLVEMLSLVKSSWWGKIPVAFYILDFVAVTLLEYVTGFLKRKSPDILGS